MLVGAVVLGIVVVGLAIWLVPRAQVGRWRRAGITSEEKLAELALQARSNMTQALGGLALIVTIALTAAQATEAQETAADNLRIADANLKLAEDGQVSERFSNAIGQLGETTTGGEAAVDVRTGALFSLMRVGLVSSTHREPVFRVVAAYVRNNYEAKKSAPDGCDAKFEDGVRADVQAALFVVIPELVKVRLKDRASRREREPPFLGLRGTRFDGLAVDELDLRRLDLTGVKFASASLNRANFQHAVLRSADLRRACLVGADFRRADLRGARLAGANLKGARFDGARLTRADLRRAPLSAAQRRVVARS